MLWSKYNFIFRSEKYGGLLYNALSNAFLAVPDVFYGKLAALHEGEELTDFNDIGLLMQLIAAKALVDLGEDVRLRDVLRMKMRIGFLSEKMVGFVVVPTLACNCACPYCFEKDHPPINMSEETENALVRFLTQYHRDAVLSISWFGGEPLFRFKQICRLTEKFRKLSFQKYTASIATNGTLLTEDVASRLNDLSIERMQITIDGPKEIHDSRRKLATGGGTFDTILQNIDGLLASGWKGKLKIRVNVDADTRDRYAEIYRFLGDRYKKYDNKVSVYSGFTYFDGVCGMNSNSVAEFALDEMKNSGTYTNFYYPRLMQYGCMALRKNSFVVGPEGELYKCEGRVGNKDFQVGSVFPGRPWNLKLLARYREGENILNDPKCLACKCFPICNDGCPKDRMAGENTCTYFLNHLPQLLEAIYDKRQKQETESAEKAHDCLKKT